MQPEGDVVRLFRSARRGRVGSEEARGTEEHMVAFGPSDMVAVLTERRLVDPDRSLQGDARNTIRRCPAAHVLISATKERGAVGVE